MNQVERAGVGERIYHRNLETFAPVHAVFGVNGMIGVGTRIGEIVHCGGI